MNELLTSDGQDFFTSYDEVYDSFDAMGSQEDLLRGIYAYGFEKPSTIQQRGLDVIRQAQSNTGKTATFCSGILQQLDCSSLECQALVLAPTRELAQQIEKGLEKPSAIQQRGLDVIQQAQFGTVKTLCSGILQQLDYSLVECQALVLAPTRELAQQIEKVMRALGVKVHACVGGTSVREDHRILSSGVHVVVGTPGPVFNMLSRQSLCPNNMKMFVLDEADEMLSRGFKDQIYDIFQLLPTQSQAGQVQVHLLCAGKRAIRRHYSASTREPRRTSCRPLERRPRRLSQSTSSKILSSPRHG